MAVLDVRDEVLLASGPDRRARRAGRPRSGPCPRRCPCRGTRSARRCTAAPSFVAREPQSTWSGVRRVAAVLRQAERQSGPADGAGGCSGRPRPWDESRAVVPGPGTSPGCGPRRVEFWRRCRVAKRSVSRLDGRKGVEARAMRVAGGSGLLGGVGRAAIRNWPITAEAWSRVPGRRRRPGVTRPAGSGTTSYQSPPSRAGAGGLGSSGNPRAGDIGAAGSGSMACWRPTAIVVFLVVEHGRAARTGPRWRRARGAGCAPREWKSALSRGI